MHSFTEVKVNRALQLARAAAHKYLWGFALEAVPEKPREGHDEIRQEGKFHSKKKSGQFLVFS